MEAVSIVGISNTKALLGGVADAAKLAIKVFGDGKFNFPQDVWHLISGGQKLGALAFVNYKAIPEEVKDLSKEELVELIQDLVSKIQESV